MAAHKASTKDLKNDMNTDIKNKRRKLLPLKVNSDMHDLTNPKTDSLKRKSEDIVIANHSMVQPKPQLILKP